MMNRQVYFERAVFLSWYCSKGDCAFCYMSIQKERIQNSRLARRSRESILAEVLLCKLLGWRIEFLSGGCDSYSCKDIAALLEDIYNINSKKMWLNIGSLSRDELVQYMPYIEGVCGPVECINPALRKRVCPSKPFSDIENMFSICNELGLRKAITIILGLGESISDFQHLRDLIQNFGLSQVTFYRLKQIKGTAYENAVPIDSGYYIDWIKRTRQAFPAIKIVAGSWLTHLKEISGLIEAGADSITKFPGIRLFGSEYANEIEAQVRKSGCDFKSNLTRMPCIDVKKEVSGLDVDDEMKEKIEMKLEEYIRAMTEKKPHI